MPDFLASPTAEQRYFIEYIWKPFAQHGQWPIFDYIEAECDKQGFDARQVLASLPGAQLPGVAGFRYGLLWSGSYMPAADTPLQLRMAGLWHLGEPLALEIADDFLHVLRRPGERGDQGDPHDCGGARRAIALVEICRRTFQARQPTAAKDLGSQRGHATKKAASPAPPDLLPITKALSA
jgi:hypothetical protein